MTIPSDRLAAGSTEPSVDEQREDSGPTFPIDPAVMRGLVWSGLALVAFTAVGFAWLMHMIMPPSPEESAAETLARVAEHQTSILIGAALVTFFWAFWVTWCAPLVVYIRRMERAPALTFAAVANAGAGGAIITMIAVSWTVMAFRVENELVVQSFHDLGWFLFLYTWPGFGIFMWIVAVAILRDRSGNQVLPRWVAWYNLYAGFAMAPASFMGLFKDGPLAWDGVFTFWVVVIDFFAWMVVMSIVLLRRIGQDQARLTADRHRSLFGEAAPA